MLDTRLFKVLIAGTITLSLAGCGAGQSSAESAASKKQAIASSIAKARKAGQIRFTKTKQKATLKNADALAKKADGYKSSQTTAQKLAEAYQKVLTKKYGSKVHEVQIEDVLVDDDNLFYDVRYTDLNNDGTSKGEHVWFSYDGLITTLKGSQTVSTGLRSR